jgi:hypothetical protein
VDIITRRYTEYEYLGYCPMKGRLFSCKVRDGYYHIVAKKGRNLTVLIAYSIK